MESGISVVTAKSIIEVFIVRIRLMFARMKHVLLMAIAMITRVFQHANVFSFMKVLNVRKSPESLWLSKE
jgi:hypothetical protein